MIEITSGGGLKIPAEHSIMKYTLGDRKKTNPLYEFNEQEIALTVW